MISCRRYGQLGNQMFQIAACIGLSSKYDIPYCVPKHTLNDELWKPYNDFENVNYCSEENGVHTATVYKEVGYTYTEIPKPTSRYYVLDGYWQSVLYWYDYLTEIKQAFGFDSLETKKEWCSIHQRRTDYLLHPTKHPVVSMEYLEEAQIKMMNEGYFKFKVFSDEIQYLKENMPQFNDCEYYFSEDKTAIEDMKEMASCGSNIISNSTFAYWAAMLNNNPYKIVIRPKIWFGEEMNHNLKDLCPKHWIAI